MNREEYKCYTFNVGTGSVSTQKTKFNTNHVRTHGTQSLQIKSSHAITLIALIITIIIMLILAGITLSLTLGERGIFNTSKKAGQEYSKQEAKEKLEVVLLDMQSEKVLNSQYNEDEYLTRRIEENDMRVSGNIVTVGNWKFEIDRTVPKIKENIEDDIHVSEETKRYVLIEVYGYLNSNCVSLNELQIYDENMNKCEYTVMQDLEYDSATLGKSYYWEDMRYHNYTNLNDGKTAHSTQQEGENNGTIFAYAGNNTELSNENAWARFVVDLGKNTNIGQIRISIGGSDGRTPKRITAYFIDNFIDGTEENSTYAYNVIQQENTGLTQIAQKEFNNSLTTPTWIEFMEVANKTTVGYLLFEIDGYIGDDGAVLNEIEIFNKKGEKKPYDILYNLEYDSVTSDKSYYWNRGVWNYTNLNDENTSYATNDQGGNNCTLFLFGNDTDSWARFVIDLNEEIKLENVDIWIGGGIYERTPKIVNIYAIENFVNGTEENSTYANNIKQNNNVGLKLISTKTFTEAQNTVQKYTFNIN